MNTPEREWHSPVTACYDRSVHSTRLTKQRQQRHEETLTWVAWTVFFSFMSFLFGHIMSCYLSLTLILPSLARLSLPKQFFILRTYPAYPDKNMCFFRLLFRHVSLVVDVKSWLDLRFCHTRVPCNKGSKRSARDTREESLVFCASLRKWTWSGQ